jgi:hypothetical protein
VPPDPADLTALPGERLLAEYAWELTVARDAFRRTGRSGEAPALLALANELLRRLALVPPDAPAPEEPPRG